MASNGISKCGRLKSVIEIQWVLENEYKKQAGSRDSKEFPPFKLEKDHVRGKTFLRSHKHGIRASLIQG